LEVIPYGRHEITQADINAVVEVLQSDFLTQGPTVPAFEQAVAEYCRAKYAIAVNSATSALHIACLALGLGDGDWLWTSSITFVASANCGLYCGAKVDFIDIDPRTYNLSIESLKDKLVQAEKKGQLPKVVVPVHLCGQSCEMEEIHKLGQKYGFKIIEDASHAIGGRYKSRPIGNCIYSDVTVFSFHPVKIITAGEGGMATTNNGQLAKKMSMLRVHGITRDANLMTQEPDGPWYYQQIDLGFNYRLTDLQAALGLSQMQRLDQIVIKRQEIAVKYNDSFGGLPVITPHLHKDVFSAFHLYVIRVSGKSLVSRQRLFELLRDQGIGVNLHYIPVHTQPFYQQMGFKWGDYPNSEAYYQEAISLPMYPSLSGEMQQRVIAAVQSILEFG
jgi:UDP-4-amino-4,6-dideoxy-N-acetyl-beta-L-altrosamine transaminase